MADRKEQFAKIEALAKEDEQFRSEIFAAVKAQDVDSLISLINSKGFELTADDLVPQSDDGQLVDDAELAAVAGGDGRMTKIDDYCGNAGAFMCGMGLAVAFWSPDFAPDKDDPWYT